MIIARTPLRISFVGGGSDLASWYHNSTGAVVSTAINKYMYVLINKRFDDSFRVSYTKTEIVSSVSDLRHEIVREALKVMKITKGLEIVTIADVPGGTGLGSSSSLTVGLLNALHAYHGAHRSAETLAREACLIEIDRLKKPIGKQDQYIAAYGGLNYIQFNQDDTVFVSPVISKKESREKLQRNLMMFYTGIERASNSILADQQRRMKNGRREQKGLKRMVELAKTMRDDLSNNQVETFGDILAENWALKKELSPYISNPSIEEAYIKALKAGATGGKLLGAGGGGFLLFYCDPDRQDAVRKAMVRMGLSEMAFEFEPQGSKIIFIDAQD